MVSSRTRVNFVVIGVILCVGGGWTTVLSLWELRRAPGHILKRK